MTKNATVSEVEWKNIIDSIPDFLSVHDLNQKIIQANKAVTDFFGVTEKEIVGKYCYEIFHGTQTAWKGCAHLRCIRSENTVTEIVDDPSIGIPLLVCCSPYYDKDGKLAGSVHVAKNITNQHLVAQENEKLISDLVKVLADIKKISGCLPICSSCKKIRDEKGSWNEIDSYMKKNASLEFSHSICPGCSERLYPEFHGTSQK